jgi:hypothetical protein
MSYNRFTENTHSFGGKTGLSTKEYYNLIRDSKTSDPVLIDKAIKYYHRHGDIENKNIMRSQRDLLPKYKPYGKYGSKKVKKLPINNDLPHRKNNMLERSKEIRCINCKHYGTSYKHDFANYNKCFERGGKNEI